MARHLFAVIVALAAVFQATVHAGPTNVAAARGPVQTIRVHDAPQGGDNMVWGNRAGLPATPGGAR